MTELTINRLDTTLKFLFYFVKAQWKAFAFIIAMSWVWAINEALFPFFIKLMVNGIDQYQGAPEHIVGAIQKPLTILVIFWLIMEAAMRSQGLVIMKAFPRFRANIRFNVFTYVGQHSYRFFQNHFAGSIANKISVLPASAEHIMEIVLFNIIALFVAITASFALLVHAGWVFGAIFISWVFLHLTTVFIFLRRGNILSEAHAESVSTLTGKIVDSITNIMSVRLFARRHYELDYANTYQKDELNRAHAALWHIEKMKILNGLQGLYLIFAMLYALIKGWQGGWVTLGDFTLVSITAFNMLGFMWFMSYQLTVYIRESGKVQEALELITLPHEIMDNPGANPLVISDGRIDYRSVSFSYGHNKPIFTDLSVTLEPGKKVGLVGFSGAGKSTFVNCLLRFYDINSGEILIDGQNIAEVTGNSLRESIAMIPQDPSLFHRTLMDNIRYGRLDASDEETLEAARLAHCDEFIRELPEGYDTMVGERGVKLSGGQRQRIAIARAMLKNAPILVLDEATSSLDSVTEKFIQDSLKNLMADRTTIVIAHRLSTLSDMDRILVFKDGAITEDGSFQSLLEAKGHFAKLWQMQSDGFLPD